VRPDEETRITANGDSLMPATYATTLSAQNVADLIAYLETLE